jgi:hypothetical protein
MSTLADKAIHIHHHPELARLQRGAHALFSGYTARSEQIGEAETAGQFEDALMGLFHDGVHEQYRYELLRYLRDVRAIMGRYND